MIKNKEHIKQQQRIKGISSINRFLKEKLLHNCHNSEIQGDEFNFIKVRTDLSKNNTIQTIIKVFKFILQSHNSTQCKKMEERGERNFL